MGNREGVSCPTAPGIQPLCGAIFAVVYCSCKYAMGFEIDLILRLTTGQVATMATSNDSVWGKSLGKDNKLL